MEQNKKKKKRFEGREGAGCRNSFANGLGGGKK